MVFGNLLSNQHRMNVTFWPALKAGLYAEPPDLIGLLLRRGSDFGNDRMRFEHA